jgi:replicative DNA helicase
MSAATKPPGGAQIFSFTPPAPPANLQAEQALLGALLANNRTIERVAGFLRKHHFADPVNGTIYQAIVDRIEDGKMADIITLHAQFRNAGILDEVGGVDYLTQLLASMVGLINAGEYGREIYDCWLRRQAIDVAESLRSACMGQDSGSKAAAAILGAMAHLENLSSGATVVRDERTLLEGLDEALAKADEAQEAKGPIGISVGMAMVDEVMGGLVNGTFTVIGGRPGSGKSSLALQWAVNAALAGTPVLYFSLEMKTANLAARALAWRAGVPLAVLKRGTHAPFAPLLVEARNNMAQAKMWISDLRGRTAVDIAAKARLMHRKHGIGLVVVDHLHIIEGEKEQYRAGGPTLVVTQAAHTLQKLAGTLDIPVVALAQLNRGLEGRDDKRPTMADLRQAGAIEEDADCICFVYRPELHYPKSAPEKTDKETGEQHANKVSAFWRHKEAIKGTAELIFEKVRDGETKAVTMKFDGSTTSFTEAPMNDEEQFHA